MFIIKFYYLLNIQHTTSTLYPPRTTDFDQLQSFGTVVANNNPNCFQKINSMNRFFTSLSMILMLSCSTIESLTETNNTSPESFITISTQTTTYTKGELVEEPKDMGSIGVYCASTGSSKWMETTEFEKLDGNRYYYDDGAWVAEDGEEPWEYETLDDYYTFFAYSPHRMDSQSLSSTTTNGELFVSYTIPTSSLEQPDLMIARPLKDTNPETVGGVPLTFFHALSSVSFGVISLSGATITGITISGVSGSGTVTWDYQTDAPKWSLGDISGDPYIVDIDSGYSLDADNAAQVTSDKGYLMMIPQELPNGATVTLSLDGMDDMVLTIPEGTVWSAGSKYHYVIQLEEEEEDCDFIFDSDELSNCYMIHPVDNEDTIIQIPIEDRINDFWLNYSSDKAEKITENSTTDDFVIDMVWHDFDESFEFTSELTYDSEGKMVAKFVVPARFKEGNFVFVVSEIVIKTNTAPYKDAVWSWHLWFTDYNPDAIAKANLSQIQAKTDMAYTLDGYNGAVHRYKDASGIKKIRRVWNRIYKDKFIMDRNIGERDILTTNYGAGSVYYQFGRKDPFPGSCATYEGGGSDPSTRTQSSYEFLEGVWFHVDFVCSTEAGSGNWCGESAARNYNCIWFDEKISNSSYDTGKSIFDPSPLGWRVPVNDTWTSFDSTTGCNDVTSVGKYTYYGYRDPYDFAELTGKNSVCYVWSANPHGADTSYNLLYSSSKVSSSNTLIMTYGLPIRAIQE